jgi:glycosyltransferase involved in cell wall biosynthesis
VTELALSEGVPLAHAVVDRLARDHDVRVLFIKGPTASAQGLRAERLSLDVDALVDPARRGVLAEALTELGWVDENPYTSPTVLPMHSLTHRHPKWPCELDLHDRFPGFFADPQDVFEQLWARRSTVEVAAQQISCTDRTAQALVLALHALRDPHDPSKAAELTDLVARVSTSFDREGLRDLAALARDLGAADTAAPFVSAVGGTPAGVGTTGSDDLRAWRLRTEPAQSTAVSWVEELRHQPKRSWPRYLWYAAWLSEHELRVADPDLPATRSAVLRARGRRLRRGLGALPGAVRSVWRFHPAPSAPEATQEGVREVVVATLLRPEGETGVQTHMQALVARLQAQGCPATVVTPFSASSPLVKPVFALRFPLRRLSRTASVRWYRHWHAHYLRRALRRHLRTPGPSRVVYAQCPVSADVALGIRQTEPVVMVAHFNVSQADEWADRGEIDRGGRYYESIRDFESEVLPRLDGIVYVSAWAGDLLQTRVAGLTAVPSVTVPNFVDLRRHGLSDPPVVGDLVSVGTLEPRKNQGYLLEVLKAAEARGHRLRLSLVGDGASRAEWTRRASDLGLADRVGFLGFRDNARAVMAGHRAYVHAAHLENLPFALIEAMAEGLPVVAGAVGGIPSMFEDGVEGLFWPLDDADAAAGILVSMLSEPGRVEQMGAAARRRAEQDYAAEVVVPRLEAFLGGVRRR